jgi:putative addiction module component (TIGR02574 family)
MEALGLDRLGVEERLKLVEEIQDSIAAEAGASPLAEEDKRDIDRRLAAYDARPHGVVGWEDIEHTAEVRLRP